MSDLPPPTPIKPGCSPLWQWLAALPAGQYPCALQASGYTGFVVV